jgi:hypothetical protein
MPTLYGRIRDRFLPIVESLGWLAPTLARLTLGMTFVGTGWGKLHSLPKVTEYFTSLNIPFPRSMRTSSPGPSSCAACSCSRASPRGSRRFRSS